MTTGMIIGPSAVGVVDPLAHPAADHLLQPVAVVHPSRQRLLQGSDDQRPDAARRSSHPPRSRGRGCPDPLMILEAWVLTTAITEMNPSSPRIRRSVSDVCEMSPIVLPSTKM